MGLRLDVIESFDPSNRSIVHRIPETGSADIRHGTQLIVHQNQEALLFRDGKAWDTFGPGRHTLKTENVPLLARMLTAPWEKSPFRALVYFVGKQTFVDQKWGTRQPITMRDQDFGVVRLRAFGKYSFRVVDAAVLINTLVGTRGAYTTDQVSAYLRDVIITRLTDLLGTMQLSLLDLPSRFDEISSATRAKIAEEFAKYGLELVDFFLNAITPPPEVQQAIDERTRTGAARNLRDFTVEQTAQGVRAPGAAPSAPPRDSDSADVRTLIRRIADSARWEVEENGDHWILTVPVGPLRKQRVHVDFARQDEAGYALVHFQSFCGPAQEEHAMAMLRHNAQIVHGAYGVAATESGEMFVVEATQLADTADTLEISRTVASLAWQADQLEQQLATRDVL